MAQRIAARLRGELAPLLIALSPVNPQSQAIQRLHQAMLDTVKGVTGQEAEWCRVGPGCMSGVTNRDRADTPTASETPVTPNVTPALGKAQALGEK